MVDIEAACAAQSDLTCCRAERRFRSAESDLREAVDELVERCRNIDPDNPAPIIGARSWLTRAIRELRRATTARSYARTCAAFRAQQHDEPR